MMQDELKKQAATQAAEMVQPNTVLGVGTGSTVAYFIDALAQREHANSLHLKAVVTTSNRSQRQLEENGFTVVPLSEVDQVDLIVDGADRVTLQLDGIKGGGGALTLEKNVAINTKHRVWIVDESKVVEHLGGFALPVEVLPVSAEQTFKRLAADQLQPVFRLKEDGSRYVTHYGNYIIDLQCDPIPVPYGLAQYLDGMVGVVEHGLFLNMTEEVLIAKADGTIDHFKKE